MTSAKDAATGAAFFVPKPGLKLPMVVLAFAGALATALSLPPATAFAQSVRPITSEESRLRLVLPGLQQRREGYTTAHTPDFAIQFFSAIQVAAHDDYPRTEVTFFQLVPGYSIQQRPTLDLDAVRERSAFLKDRDLTGTSAVASDQRGDRRTLRFTTDGADCVAFDVLPDGIGTPEDPVQPLGRTRVIGYYCTAVGGRMNDGEASRVLSGIEINARDVPGWRSIGR